jgi:hypothetical protein
MRGMEDASADRLSGLCASVRLSSCGGNQALPQPPAIHDREQLKCSGTSPKKDERDRSGIHLATRHRVGTVDCGCRVSTLDRLSRSQATVFQAHEWQGHVVGHHCLEQPNSGVDGFDVDQPGLPGLKIDRAVDIDALTPARLRSQALSCLGAQQPTGRAAWVGCTASTNSTASSSPKEFKSCSLR